MRFINLSIHLSNSVVNIFFALLRFFCYKKYIFVANTQKEVYNVINEIGGVDSDNRSTHKKQKNSKRLQR